MSQSPSKHSRAKPGDACESCYLRKMKCGTGWRPGHSCDNCIKHGRCCLPKNSLKNDNDSVIKKSTYDLLRVDHQLLGFCFWELCRTTKMFEQFWTHEGGHHHPNIAAMAQALGIPTQSSPAEVHVPINEDLADSATSTQGVQTMKRPATAHAAQVTSNKRRRTQPRRTSAGHQTNSGSLQQAMPIFYPNVQMAPLPNFTPVTYPQIPQNNGPLAVNNPIVSGSSRQYPQASQAEFEAFDPELATQPAQVPPVEAVNNQGFVAEINNPFAVPNFTANDALPPAAAPQEQFAFNFPAGTIQSGDTVDNPVVLDGATALEQPPQPAPAVNLDWSTQEFDSSEGKFDPFSW